jgi:alpha-glucosidase
VSDGGHVWWEDAVVYEVYPRSFADADGDGVGDLPGLRSRLGYLADLGVDAIWLTPFYPSPLSRPGRCARQRRTGQVHLPRRPRE